MRIPPLRERDIDIDLLVEHFNRKLALRHGVPERQLSAEIMAVLRAYSWPGNVREMRNVIENMLLMSSEPVVTLDDLPAELLDEIATSGAMPSLRDDGASLEETERLAIARAVHNAHGNLAQAARTLGVSRSTLDRKIELYQLEGIVKPGARERDLRGPEAALPVAAPHVSLQADTRLRTEPSDRANRSFQSPLPGSWRSSLGGPCGRAPHKGKQRSYGECRLRLLHPE